MTMGDYEEDGNNDEASSVPMDDTDDLDEEEEAEGEEIASAAQSEENHTGTESDKEDDDSLDGENVEVLEEDLDADDGDFSTATPDGDGSSVLKDQETPEVKSTSRKRKTPSRSSEMKRRAPSVAGLTIPFRTVKKAMKLDPDIPIVQNEAAIAVTCAVELFLKTLANDSFQNARNRGRNTVRYEDIAEARTNNKALAFLETLLP